MQAILIEAASLALAQKEKKPGDTTQEIEATWQALMQGHKNHIEELQVFFQEIYLENIRNNILIDKHRRCWRSGIIFWA